jgi:hypothetical protein
MMMQLRVLSKTYVNLNKKLKNNDMITKWDIENIETEKEKNKMSSLFDDSIKKLINELKSKVSEEKNEISIESGDKQTEPEPDRMGRINDYSKGTYDALNSQIKSKISILDYFTKNLDLNVPQNLNTVIDNLKTIVDNIQILNNLYNNNSGNDNLKFANLVDNLSRTVAKYIKPPITEAYNKKFNTDIDKVFSDFFKNQNKTGGQKTQKRKTYVNLTQRYKPTKQEKTYFNKTTKIDRRKRRY